MTGRGFCWLQSDHSRRSNSLRMFSRLMWALKRSGRTLREKRATERYARRKLRQVLKPELR
jgi:hypothetical protein